ncbi:DMT family transporter [Desulfococcaceae bacterium HSG8]|nr:DMT family transporter [Desulfococcaceae bacterium HSG8]
MNYTANELRDRPVTGALFVLGSSLTIAMLCALVKMLSASLSNEMIVFFRNLCALVFLLPWVLHRPPSGGIKTEHFRLHLARCASGLGAMYCFFYLIANMQLAEAVLFTFTAPLFIPIVAYLWLKEPVSPRVRNAIIIGFIGVLLILKPDREIFRPLAFVGLGAGILVALAMVSIRRMSASEPPVRIVFYFTLLSTPISAVPLLWSRQLPQGDAWCLLVLIGFLAVVGQFMLTKGYSLAAAARVGPFSYGSIIFSTLIGWLFWDETLDLLTWVGAFLICMAGIIASWSPSAREKPRDNSGAET